MSSKSGSKTPSEKKGTEKEAAKPSGKRGEPPKERLQFKTLLLSNPNYFGNIKDSAFKAIKVLSSDTSFEELMCVGYNPQLRQLEAVIYIKQDSGYGGGVCSSGTFEYVRFYLSFDNGATWEDVGMEQFTVNDISGPKPLEYGVTRAVKPRRKFCFFENLPKVRAILSWNLPPPANTPNFTPVWGNVREANIQVEPFKLFKISDLIAEKQIQIQPDIAALLDTETELKAAEPKALNLAQLHSQYKDKKVPAHRFLFPAVQKHIASPESGETVGAALSTGLLQELKINVLDVLDLIQKTDGNTTFEELKCIGLNTNNDTLLGILTVKLQSGYSGNLCSAGSREYVAFWVDWEDGTGWHHVGTTSVIVHDINNLPPGGLQYAVFTPLNTLAHRRPCETGPRTARIRAILAWEEIPPAGNPDFVPTWGNREETRVFIKPGPQILPGETKPYLETVGGVPVCHIDQSTGFAPGERPFGGVVNITGFIIGAPDLSAIPLKYKLSVRQLPGGLWVPLNNSFDITVLEQIGGGIPTSYGITQAVDSDGFYTFREDMNATGLGWRLVTGRLLGQWITAAPMTGLWEIKVEAKDFLGTIYTAGTILCSADGTTRQNVKIFLDEIAPKADVTITGFSRGGGPVQPAIDCATLQKGDIIHGQYTALDPDGHFGSLSLTVQPSGPAHGATVNPSSRSYPVVSTNGEVGNWTLDTSAMDPCGYVVRLNVADRTIVHSNAAISWTDEDFVGFCLAAVKK